MLARALNIPFLHLRYQPPGNIVLGREGLLHQAGSSHPLSQGASLAFAKDPNLIFVPLSIH